MRFKNLLWLGSILPMALLFSPLPSDANDGLFSRHHGDCDAKSTTVRLPAQQIRIETARPRVIVSEGTAVRGYRQPFAVGVPMVPMMLGGPIVASFLVPPQESNRPSSASSALRASHELELQALEVTRLRAAHEAEVAAMNQVHQRIMAGLAKASGPSTPAPTTSTDLSQIKTEIEKLSQRISDIERLLIIHDELLKKNNIKDKGN